jgi:glycosyltransferase involved in cell wall biosynthesis
MSVHDSPLVSVVTPVYNGAPYLAECIESVLGQTYSNFEHIIMDNCSTDGTSKIANEYAKKDSRIRVYRNDVLLDIIPNHNRAFRLISAESKYCKVVCGDDWIFPECIARMTLLAEAHPSIGVISAYQLSGGGTKWYVRTDGLPYSCTIIPGREIGRLHLLGKLDVLGNPTSNMYRSDLVRAAESFFPNASAEADISACFEQLRVSDFGFVHQVLSHERLHERQITNTSKDLNAYLSSRLSDLIKYGPYYLTKAELDMRLDQLLDEYYAYLALSAVNFRHRKFWNYHIRRLRELGFPLDGFRLAKAIIGKILDLLLNPKQTVERVVRRSRSV